MVDSAILQEFEEISRTLSNPQIEAWKSQGKKVLGYNCSYFPEEMVHAAGLLPFRIRATGCTETPRADSYLARANCSFARACLEQLLQGEYDFLDGLVCVSSCDHVRRMYDNWKQALQTGFMTVMSLPKKVEAGDSTVA